MQSGSAQEGGESGTSDGNFVVDLCVTCPYYNDIDNSNRFCLKERCVLHMMKMAEKVKKIWIRDSSLQGCVIAVMAALMVPSMHNAAYAQSATPGSVIVLEEIVVEGRRMGEEDLAREKLEAIPGGTGLIVDSALRGKTNLNISDALVSTPGVVVQNFFGGNDQPRIQIRGSGLQQNPVERGILVLQNGLPINRADGSYAVGLANARQAQFTEVYRGYTANRLGATVLGGALNFVSPTGSSAPGVTAGMEGGSFGQVSASAQAGGKQGSLDGLAQVHFSQRDGFRVYNESERLNVDANVGVELTETISSRLFVGYTDLSFDVAGPLPKDRLNRDPTQVHPGPTVRPNPTPPPGLLVSNPGPNVIRDQPQREADQFRVVSRTTATSGAQLADLVLGYTFTGDAFRFPIPGGIRETEGGDFTAVLRYAYSPDQTRTLPLFEATAKYVVGSAERRNFINRAGAKGPLFGQSELDASTLSLYAGLNISIGDAFTLSPAVAFAQAERDNADTFGAAMRPTIAFNPGNQTMPLPGGQVPAGNTSYSRSYDGWSPSLALTIQPKENQTVFAAFSRSFEPPTHDDLIATVGGTPFSSPGRPMPPNPSFPAPAFRTPDLKAQTATTIEGGWRGRSGIITWDAVTYFAWVKNELLSLRDVTGAPLGAVNADDTTHFGIELGLSAQLTEELGSRLAYTYQDFRFDGDPVRGNNRLAGAPPHVVNAIVQYNLLPELLVQTEINWRAARTPVDNMNTLFNDSFVVVDFRANYEINDHFSVFGEARNVFDKVYASSTLIVDQARPDQAAFLPGDGRAFYAGLKARF